MNPKKRDKMKKILFVIWFFSITIYADEHSLLDLVRNMPLLQNNANFIEENGKIYLVGVGKSVIRGNDAQAKITAIKESQIKAQKAILSLTHGTEMTVKEELSKITTTTKLVVNGKVIAHDRKQTKRYEQVIKELGNGILVKLKKLGKWKQDGSYFFAYYVMIS